MEINHFQMETASLVLVIIYKKKPQRNDGTIPSSLQMNAETGSMFVPFSYSYYGFHVA